MLLYFIRAIFVVMIAAFLFVGINYRQAEEAMPADAESLYNKGLSLEAEGKVDEAMKQYRNALEVKSDTSFSGEDVMAIFISGMVIAIIVIAVDWLTPRKSLNALAGIFFGLLVGILLSWATSPILEMINDLYFHMKPLALQMSKWIMGICICYLVISLVIQTKDDVRFVIPYVEFSRQTKGLRPLVLDTSVIIDGRIADLAQTRLFDAPLVVPRFVLNELQLVADSPDKIKRNRGRRGLDMLNKLQSNPVVEVQIDDTPPPGVELKAEVDQKLVAFSKDCDGRLVTNDYNLNKVAQLRGVDVININDLANALKTVVLPGEPMQVKIIRPGEEMQQGIGYLDDGTMVVVEGARDKIAQTVALSVTSALQTSAGKMIFGKYERTVVPAKGGASSGRRNNRRS
jgi:uncharacterized protein YacL